MKIISSRSLKIFAISATLAAATLIIETEIKERDPVQEHLHALAKLRMGPFLPPHGVLQWFRIQTAEWLLLGRPTYQRWTDDLEAHQNALVELGYYDRRWLPWRDKDPVWESAFTNTSVWKTRYTIRGNGPSEIIVTVRPNDIDEFEKIIRRQIRNDD